MTQTFTLFSMHHFKETITVKAFVKTNNLSRLLPVGAAAHCGLQQVGHTPLLGGSGLSLVGPQTPALELAKMNNS